MVYVPKTWSSGTPILAADLNHLQEQYQVILDYLTIHNHNSRYYLKAPMDSYFWSAENDGSGSGLDADLLEGAEGSSISSGMDAGIIGFLAGTLANFTGHLLTGYPNWHIANGIDGSQDLTELFPIGASALGSGYQVSTTVGTRTIKPAGTVFVQTHILTFYEIMHTHVIPQMGPGDKTGSGDTGSYIPFGAIGYYPGNPTGNSGSGLGHGHPGSFEGSTSELFPPFIALIPIQYGNWDGANWTP
jgi:hypothetical protein